MTVAELRTLLANVADDLEVVLDATSYDDPYVSAVDGAASVSVEDRSDGLKLYIIGERER